MIDPIVSKLPSSGLDSVAKQGEASPVKVGESKFDQVRAQLLDQQAKQVELPPEVKQVPFEQQNTLKTELARQLEKSNGSPQELFSVRMKRTSQRISQLTTRVNSLPKTPGFEPLRQRLASIDHQYQSAGKLVSSMGQSANPADLMKAQMQMYQLTENLELMSKVVEQVTSGVKSVLQTQL